MNNAESIDEDILKKFDGELVSNPLFGGSKY